MIQYNHLNQTGTLFIDTPSKQELLDLLVNHKNLIKIKTGLAIKYYQDQFNKSIGRQVSEEKAEVVEFVLERTEHYDNKIVYYFGTYEMDHETRIVLTTVLKSDRVFLISAWSA
jgi:hypothetical protein